MDEYTLVCCRRYKNINVHRQNDVINLGLIRMLESCGAEKILVIGETVGPFWNNQHADICCQHHLYRHLSNEEIG